MNSKAAAILGGCIIIAALIVVRVPRPVPTAAEKAVEPPRYQFMQGNSHNIFVLDTRTGRLWQKFVDSNSGPTQWTENDGPWFAAGSE